jgi:hypothetical protein
MAALTPEESYLRKLVGLPPRPAPMIPDPADPEHRELTTAEAAAAAHVSESTIRDWARRELIRPVNVGDQHPRYLEIDVLRVEAATRRAARARRLAEEAAQDHANRPAT